jgi:hypothetical protein
MPLIKAYNIDSDLYGLKGHSIFKSVRPFIFGYVVMPKLHEWYLRRQLQPKLSLSAGPSATKHGPNRGKVRARLHSGTRFTGYHISRHVFSTFKRLTQVSTH